MKSSLFLICLAAILWGTTGTTMVLMNQVAPMNPLLVAFWRLAIASPLLLFCTYRNNFLTSLTSHSWKTYLGLGACMASYQACYFGAVSLTGVAVAALVSICSAPIFITLLAAKFLEEKLTSKIYLALGLGLIGTSLLVINPQATNQPQGQFLGGVLLALGAGLAYAIYTVGAKIMIKNLDPFTVLALSFTAAGFMLSPALLFTSSKITYNWLLQIPFLLYLGLVATGFAYLIYIKGLKSTKATTAGIATLLEPLTANCLGILVFHEKIGINSAIGAVLLLGAIAILSFQKQHKT